VEIHPHAGIDELIKLLTSARYFLFLTHGEGSARTVGEAMHAGVIVLTTQEAGMPFNENALIDVTNRSAVEICELIKNLENDPELCLKISGEAVDYIATLEKNYLPNLIEYCNSR
jgi:glycosyltransferase involved in cell wall biosynthesis